MKKPSENNLYSLIQFGLFALSGLFLILYVYIAIQRVFFPFDIEWAEGAALLQVKQILAGEGLYQAPNLAFMPLVYTPVYHYLSAFVSLLVGEGFLGLRLLSFISSIAAAGMIFWIVYRETEDGFAGWISSTLYLACFQLSGGFYDLARVDSLFIFVILGTLLLFLRARNGFDLAVAGIMVAVSFFTKQTALLVFMPILVYAGFHYRWKSLYLYSSSLLGIGVTILIWSRISSGWFQYYIFQLPQEHGYSIIDAVNFWVGDTLRPLGIAFVFGLILIFHWLKRDSRSEPGSTWDLGDEKATMYVLFFLGCFLGAWITRASNGGAENNIMPAYASISIMLGFGFARAKRWLDEQEGLQQRGKLFVNLMVMVQFIALLYNPLTYIPTPADKRTNQVLIEIMEQTEGEIFIPYRSHLPGYVGKQTHAHVVSIFELVGYFHGDVQPQGVELLEEIREKIREQEYGVVILDHPMPWFKEALDVNYRHLENEEPEHIGSRSEVMEWQGGLDNMYVPLDQNR